MKSQVYYHFGNPWKVRFRKHFCLSCGNNLVTKKHCKIVNSKSPEAVYYDFTYGDTNKIKGECNFIHKIFYCSKCGKEIEFVTQLTYEDNIKWMNKAYNKLLNHFKPNQISKVWVDSDNNYLNYEPDIDNLRSIFFLLKLGEKEFKIPCSYTSRTKYWERPIVISKDKNYKNSLVGLIKKNSV